MLFEGALAIHQSSRNGSLVFFLYKDMLCYIFHEISGFVSKNSEIMTLMLFSMVAEIFVSLNLCFKFLQLLFFFIQI